MVGRYKVSIIGAGRVGSTLAYLLKQGGYSIGGMSCRREESARRAVEFVSGGVPCRDNGEAVGDSDIILITTPDQAIATVARQLRGARIDWKGRIAYHCSGCLSSDILSPLAEVGSAIGSLHPLHTFAQPAQTVSRWKGCYFFIEGDARARQVALEMSAALGGKGVVISPQQKPLYHASATMASNYLVSLIWLSLLLWERIGIPFSEGVSALMPLIKGTFEDIAKLGVASALTGPVVRGDLTTIKAHLQALREADKMAWQVYCKIGAVTAELASRNGLLSSQQREELLGILQAANAS